MPRSIHTINKFKTGIHSEQDARDLPEGAIADGINVMTDVEGKIRQMGRDIPHPLTTVIDHEGFVNTPGYGFFTFGADQKLVDNINEINGDLNVETSLLAYQTGAAIGIYDVEAHDNLLTLGPQVDNVQPTFYYSLVDGALRVSDSYDGNIDIVVDEETSEQTINFTNSNFITKYFKFMNKTWFSGLGSDYEISHKGWINNNTDGLDSFIYPPTIQAYGTPAILGAGGIENDHTLIYENATNASNAIGSAQIEAGNIIIQVSDGGANDNSDWLAQTLYKFGVSFMYEGGQESQVTNFTETWGLELSDDGDDIELRVYVKPGADVFDPRITGYNIYLTGDDSGFYEDPYFLAEFYWGSSSLDPPRLTTSDGTYTEAFAITNDTVRNAAPQTIVKTPVITYSMRNGYRTDSESIAINAKTSVIANRRCYAGNIRKYAFDIHTIASSDINSGQNESWKQPAILPHSSFIERDTMIVSPVDKYDIFPDDNRLNIGNNDGDHIVLLLEYSDKLLQFKENKLYIVNISEDIEFVESDNDFMGITYPYQAIRVDGGIAWINQFGCFYYNGDEIINLIEGKISKSDSVDVDSTSIPSWESFVGKTAMIGYIPKNQHIVIFQSPATDTTGNIWVYDMVTESWTRGFDRVLPSVKSNVITTYDNSLLYASPINNSAQEFSTTSLISSQISTPELWRINNVNSASIDTDPQGSRLKIGDNNITDIMNYPDDANEGETFSYYLKRKIEQYTDAGTFDFAIGNPDMYIIREGHKIDGTYSGKSISWDTSSSMGAPATDETDIVVSPLVSDASQKFFNYVDSSDFNTGSFATAGVGWTEGGYGSSVEATDWIYDASPFQHRLKIGWSGGEGQFMPGLFEVIANYTTSTAYSSFESVTDDEPRIKINRVDGSNYTWADASTATELVVDLYSKQYRADRLSIEQLSPHCSGSVNSTKSNEVRPPITKLAENIHMSHELDIDYGKHISPGGFYNDNQLNGYNDPLYIQIAYSSAIKEDGSGESTTDNGSILKQHVDAGVGAGYYEALSTITLPSVIFTDAFVNNNSFEPSEHKYILIPGSYAHMFGVGGTYTFTNTGKSSNNQAYKIYSKDLYVFSSQYENTSIEDDKLNNYRTLTVLSYIKLDNSSFFDNVINWTTFNDVTITGAADMITFGTHSVGSKPVRKQKVLFPYRRNLLSTQGVWTGSIEGQNSITSSKTFNIANTEDEKSLSVALTNEFQEDYMNRTTVETPFWDMSFYKNIPNWSRLFCKNGAGITTTGNLTNSDTTPFDITLKSGVVLEQVIEAIEPLDVLLAKSGANYEYMSVDSISGSTITVTRNYLSQSSTGSAVNFGTADVDWYRATSIKVLSSTTFEISGDYESLFTNGTYFWIRHPGTYNDTGGGNAWSGGGYSGHHALTSAYNSATNRTLIAIHGDYDNYGASNYATTLGGTVNSTYIRSLSGVEFADNMAGDEPLNESISPILVNQWTPEAGSNTTHTGGRGIHTDNQCILLYGIHVIDNNPDFYSDGSDFTDVYTGVTIRQFNNDVIDSKSSNSASIDYPPMVLTHDVVLDDDISTAKVLYSVSVTYRSSNGIIVSAILNGSSTEIMLTGDNEGGGGSGRSSGGRESNYGGWIKGKFYPGFRVKNMKTIQIKIVGGESCSGFEVNDISIEYRTLDKGR